MFPSRRAALGGDVFRDEYSLAFDGTDDKLIVSDANDLSFTTGGLTVMAWVKMTDATQFPIVGKGIYNNTAEYQFKVEGDDKITWWVADESVASCHIGRTYDTVLTTYQNQWIHLAGTYDGGTASSGLKIYLNGTQVTSWSVSADPTQDSDTAVNNAVVLTII